MTRGTAMSELLDYMYKENLENKVRHIGSLINIKTVPDEVITNCIAYINKIFEIVEQKRPDSNDAYDDLVFSLIDVILLKHLKLSYLAWLKDNIPLDK
jgi:hypothetical protein